MKLASIERIVAITAHSNADSLECAQVQEWNSIVRKGEFHKGDKIIFVPIDTLIPGDKDWCAFLRKDTTISPIRIKIVKLRGIVSAGIIFPLNILLEGRTNAKIENDILHYEIDNNIVQLPLEIGTDIAELLGITKYVKEIDIHIGGNAKGNFPSQYISKTDEDNLLSNKSAYEELIACKCPIEISAKLDGCSGSFILLQNEEHKVCSRNLELQNGDNVYWNMYRKYQLNRSQLSGLAIQGECVGPKIQNNPLGLSEIDMFVFNIKDLLNNTFMDQDQMREFCNLVGLKVVPILGTFKDIPSIANLQNIANSIKYPNGQPGEGIVIRPIRATFSRSLQKNLSLKIINQNYKD